MTRAVPVFTKKIYTLIVLFLTPISNLQLDPAKRLEVHNWLFFQHGGIGPYFGQFGHFFVYAPCKIPYAIDRSETRVISLCEIQFGVDTDMHPNNPKQSGRKRTAHPKQSVANARCTMPCTIDRHLNRHTQKRHRKIHSLNLYPTRQMKGVQRLPSVYNDTNILGHAHQGGEAAAVGFE